MAHAIFNVSPVKFLSSIQDHVFTVTPTFKNKTYTNKSDKRKSYQQQQQQDDLQRSSASPVTLQLTLPTESIENQMTEIPQNNNNTYKPNHFASPTAAPIDIPRSYPLNVPMNSHSHRGGDYEGLIMPNNLLSTSYNSHHSYSHQQENNLISLANSISQSPYLPAEDLTVHFDGLAVRSPTGSFYSNGGLYSPQQINSPINIGSPHHGYGSPNSPIYFGGGCSPQSTSFNNNFLAGSPSFNNNQSFVGSPNSPPQFLGSPSFNNNNNNNTNELGIDTSFSDLSGSYGFTYLSPSLSATQGGQLSPLNSPSPTGSYANNLYLFPPSNTANHSRPSSPVPDDVILTASEVNDYINSPYLSATTPSPSLVVQPLNVITEDNYYNNNNHDNQISEFLFGHQQRTTADDMELFPTTVTTSAAIVSPSSPHTQPQPSAALFFSEDDEEDDDDDEVEEMVQKQQRTNRKSITATTTPSGRRAKIHKCPYCNHTSNRANNMREHTQIHNPNRPKPHACKLCNRAFARKHDMNRHYISCKKQHSKSGGGNNRYVMTSPSLNPST